MVAEEQKKLVALGPEVALSATREAQMVGPSLSPEPSASITMVAQGWTIQLLQAL
jgi:hypothetical protein